MDGGISAPEGSSEFEPEASSSREGNGQPVMSDRKEFERITSDSELTEEDVEQLAREVDSNVAERLLD